MSPSKVLITGISGQDGIYLSSHLLKNYEDIEIYGVTRSKEDVFFNNLKKVNDKFEPKNIKLINLNLYNKDELKSFFSETIIDKIAHLSGPSSVYRSFSDPESYKRLIIDQFDNLTNACIENNFQPTFFQAGSSEMFSSKAALPLSETSEMKPRSPYAEAKYTLHNRVIELRNDMNWNIKSGIMFNHESEFRANEFLIMKIINTVIDIKESNATELTIGSLDHSRDWSYAMDIAEAIGLILFEADPVDYVIGSGEGNTIRNLIEIVSNYFDIDYKSFTKVDENLLRDGDPSNIVSNPSLIRQNLGWETRTSFESMVKKIINYRLKSI